jgi:hypothetical protein
VPTGEASLLYELVPTGEPDFAAGRACRAMASCTSPVLGSCRLADLSYDLTCHRTDHATRPLLSRLENDRARPALGRSIEPVPVMQVVVSHTDREGEVSLRFTDTEPRP